MIKLEHDGVIYYFGSFNALYGAINGPDPWSRQNPSPMKLMQFAEFAVDLKEREIIKTRYDVRELIEAYYEKKERELQ